LKALVVNMFAGPGAGKTSMRAGTFAELKWRGIDCEEAPEFAKDLTWEERFSILSENQDYVFGKQLHRIKRLSGKVDVIITDSPILFSIIYDAECDEDFRRHIFRKFNQFSNLNFFINRVKPYNPNGRSQTLEQAIEKDKEVKAMLDKYQVPYITIPGARESVDVVVDEIIKRIFLA
jgi:hypothetical protein